MSSNRLTADRLDLHGCMALVYAMLRQMSREFRVVYAYYLLHPFDMDAYNAYRLLREDFLADRFHNLTSLDGRKIVDRLEEIVSRKVYTRLAYVLGEVGGCYER